MEIYFSSSTKQPQLTQNLERFITKFGKILNRLRITGKVNQKRAYRFHDRCVLQLERADVMVAEVSHPSLKVGYELCLAEQLDLPTVILHRSDAGPVSPMVTGDRKLSVSEYHNTAQAHQILQQFLTEFQH